MSSVKSTDTNKLLEALKSDQTVETQTIDLEQDSVLSFVHKYNIKSGEYAVKTTVLYKLYKSSCVDEPINRMRFSYLMGLHFHSYSNSRGIFFLIDRSSFTIAESILNSTQPKRNKLTSVTYQRHFKTFLEETGINTGTTWTEGFIIFEAYRYYCIDRKLNLRFSYDYFIKFLKLHFNHRRVTQNRSLWFAIDSDLSNYFTEEQKDEIREKRKNPKKANKAFRKRVSISRSFFKSKK